jgi:hypothetical protein
VAEPYKSVLEKHNENLARKRRLPTPEEQAIEPVYPEEYLVGGPGKAVASGFLGSGRQAAKDAARYRIAQTKIGERAIDVNADKAAAEAFAKTPAGKATYEALKKRAEQRKEVKDLKTKERELLGSAERASKNISGELGIETSNQIAEERRNAAGDTYKKGGKVKATASSRADGCAVKGKTKGRMM